MTEKRLKRQILFAFKAIMAVVLIVLLIREVDWLKIWSEVSQASIPLLFVALLLYIIGIFMCIERWWRAAQFKKFAMTFRNAMEFYFAGLFLNNFLPSFLGGDAYQSYILGKSEKRYPAAISTVMFTRFIGLWTTIVLFLIFGLLGYSEVFAQPLFAWFGILSILFMVANVAITLVYSHPKCQSLFDRFPGKIRKFFKEIDRYAKWHFLRDNFVLSAAFAIVGVGLFNLVLFYALGEHVPIFPYLATVFLISLVSSLPVSINNIGFKEWAYYAFFPLIGIRPEAALAVALLVRSIQVLVSIAGAPFFFKEKKTYGTEG